jgi:DNA-directed RNA polymerase sigma subunit (sigma70/sigma32)
MSGLLLLGENERQAVDLYFGISAGEKKSYAEVGKMVHLSREGARRAVLRGIQKLQENKDLLPLLRECMEQ